MIELASPIRLYWDFAPNRTAGEEIAAICSGITSLRFLSIHLKECGDSLSPGISQAISLLAGPGRALMLSAPSTLIESGSFPEELRLLVLDGDGEAELRRAVDLRNRIAPLQTAAAFHLPAVSLESLPHLLVDAVDAGFREIHLPMQRLTSGESCWIPLPEELEELSQSISALQLPADIRFTIHDPFLWKAFHPDTPFPDGGCQAANTMLYIASDDTVYPCPMAPVPLGSLTESSLREIAISVEKKSVRALIRQLPEICVNCPDIRGCAAG